MNDENSEQLNFMTWLLVLLTMLSLVLILVGLAVHPGKGYRSPELKVTYFFIHLGGAVAFITTLISTLSLLHKDGKRNSKVRGGIVFSSAILILIWMFLVVASQV